MATQMTPLVWRTVKASVSAVAVSAAKMRSPSFSRSASSVTTTGSPRRMASRAASTDSRPRHQPSSSASGMSTVPAASVERPIAGMRPRVFGASEIVSSTIGSESTRLTVFRVVWGLLGASV